MAERKSSRRARQQELFDDGSVRSMLGQLLDDSKLYKSGQDYQDLLDFVVRLRNFAPFNALLLQIQKPGLRFAASARDWRERFGLHPKEDARPLLILWPFGPVALVYDVQDVEGGRVPEDVSSFAAHGPVGEDTLHNFLPRLIKANIDIAWIDAGDGYAGSVQVVTHAKAVDEKNRYRLAINRNHKAPVKFATLAHELAHLFLGHLGADRVLKIKDRRDVPDHRRELEAELVGYIVCQRIGVQSRSQAYLSNFVGADTVLDEIDLYLITRAAGRVESMLGVEAHAKFDAPELRKQSGRAGSGQLL